MNILVIEDDLKEWVSGLRKSYKKNTLSKERIKKLNKIEGWVWDFLEHKWQTSFKLLKDFAKNNGSVVCKKLSSWNSQQRKIYKKGKLSQEKIDLLNSIDEWYWEK